MKVVIFGVTGMLGSMVWKFFSCNTGYELVGTARSSKDNDSRICQFDAENFSNTEIEKILSGCDYAINCIGLIKSHINDDKQADVMKALQINSLFPHHLALAAKKTGVKVIQIATDCVYDGVKGKYVEIDKHNALDVYGKTKSLGEINSDNFLNLRCSIIGQELTGKKSLLEWFLNQPNGAELRGFTNHYWNGITTDAFARICYGIIKNDAWFNGMQHVVPSDIVTKFQMLLDFADIYERKDIKILSFEANPSVNRSIATQNLERNLQLWKNANYHKIPTIKDMVREMKLNSQMV